MARHNKKRNVGLIYEQLIMGLTKAIVDNDKNKVATIKNIIKTRFKKGTELHREFRLFNALIKTSGTPESLATRILQESHRAAVDHDATLLDREKSALIKDINHKINESTFYGQKVQDYKNYATIQTLLNNWRSKKPDVQQSVIYESQIHSWLCRPSDTNLLNEHVTEGVNDLSVQIMERKFNKKYHTSLDKNQRFLLNAYLKGNHAVLETKLSALKKETTTTLRNYKRRGKNRILLEKTNNVLGHITDAKIGPTGEGVIKGMVLCQLLNEINEDQNE